MTAAADSWGEVLTRLREDLDRLDAALEAGAEVVSLPWVPPTDLGPLPELLRPAAEELLARIARSTERTRVAQAELSGQQRDVDRRRAAGAAYHGIARGTGPDRTA